MCIPLAIAGAIAGIGALGSAAAGVVGAENARASQEDAAKKAMSVQERALAQQQANSQPYLDAGKQSLAQLIANMRGGAYDRQINPADIANDPGYQFRMAEGQKALERSAAARGGLNSGGFMKGLARYSQGVASDEYNNAWNRNQAQNASAFSRLASMAGIGQAAASGQNANIGQYGGNMANLYGALGNARAAGAMGTANAVSGGLGALGNMAMLGGMAKAGLLGGPGDAGGGGQIPTQVNVGYSGMPYGSSSLGYVTQGFGPWA